MRKPILAGNWKMNKTASETTQFFAAFHALATPAWAQAEVIIAAPYTLLSAALAAVTGHDTRIIAQNVHYETSGAFTGEISVGQLQDLGITGAIVGHSERREYFGETDRSVAKKVAKLLSHEMLAIACVGETQAEREGNQTEAIITRQVRAVLAAAPSFDNLVIAYEPVWAIGTGLTASDEQAQAVHKLIRQLAADHAGKDAASQLRILYGGSAKPSNIGGLMSQPDIDGGLVGGASLMPDDFAAMVTTVTD